MTQHAHNSHSAARSQKGPRPSRVLSGLDAEISPQLADIASRRIVQAGETLFLQQSPHSHSFVIQTGLVRTFYVSGAGREVTLAYWSDGDIVGGPALFGGGAHIWSAVANRRSEVLAITGADLRKLAESNPKVMNWIVNTLEFKLRWLSVLFQIHGTERVHDRLAKLLLMMAELYGEDDGGDIVIEQRISQSDLATLVGASRQWTNRALANLRDEGVIGMDGSSIRLHDAKALRSILEDYA